MQFSVDPFHAMTSAVFWRLGFRAKHGRDVRAACCTRAALCCNNMTFCKSQSTRLSLFCSPTQSIFESKISFFMHVVFYWYRREDDRAVRSRGGGAAPNQVPRSRSVSVSVSMSARRSDRAGGNSLSAAWQQQQNISTSVHTPSVNGSEAGMQDTDDMYAARMLTNAHGVTLQREHGCLGEQEARVAMSARMDDAALLDDASHGVQCPLAPRQREGGADVCEHPMASGRGAEGGTPASVRCCDLEQRRGETRSSSVSRAGSLRPYREAENKAVWQGGQPYVSAVLDHTQKQNQDKDPHTNANTSAAAVDMPCDAADSTTCQQEVLKPQTLGHGDQACLAMKTAETFDEHSTARDEYLPEQRCRLQAVTDPAFVHSDARQHHVTVARFDGHVAATGHGDGDGEQLHKAVGDAAVGSAQTLIVVRKCLSTWV
jgi:hypothetical protein